MRPSCAEYLEFWYISTATPGDGEAGIYYLDGTERWWYLAGYKPEWTLVHLDLDTSKLVRGVEVGTYPSEGSSYGDILVDDFDLEACAAPPVAVPVGGELLTPTPALSPVMLIAVMAAASAVALGYKLTRK